MSKTFAGEGALNSKLNTKTAPGNQPGDTIDLLGAGVHALRCPLFMSILRIFFFIILMVSHVFLGRIVKTASLVHHRDGGREIWVTLNKRQKSFN
ncbi:hypothetical protein GL267_004805 [Acidithiobacillus ferrianus]|uniref:Uncharacterized protein n=2 Tax=Acidithiobacillus ferrianus TaxID=2678518 RepID=A0A845UBZ2_9PROT|nr:hypothetical protein [Acidithiobacillus ferrianus]NDU43689.1 hypothetical protein [Acidithiobacillus ferrianus]